MTESALEASFRQEVHEAVCELTSLTLSAERVGAVGESARTTYLRTLHSLKGAATLVGDSTAARLLHVTESLFQAPHLDLGACGDRFFDLVLGAFDLLSRRVAAEAGGQKTGEAEVERLIAQIGALSIEVGGPSHDLTRTFPGLRAPHLEILTDQQEERLAFLGRGASAVLLIDIVFPIDRFTELSNSIQSELEGAAEVVSCSSEGVDEGGGIRFSYIVSTDRSRESIDSIAAPYRGRVSDARGAASGSGPAPRPGEGPPETAASREAPAPPSTDDALSEEILYGCRRHYMAELPEKIDEISALLERLGREPGDPGLIDAIFRFGHSLKGTAGTLRYPILAEFGGALEDALAAVRSGRVAMSGGVVDLFLDWLTELEGVGKTIAAGSSGGRKRVDVLDRLKALAAGDTGVVTAVRAVEPPRFGNPVPERDSPPGPGASRAERSPAVSPGSEPERAEETIRVGLAKIDAIINTAGELVNRKNGLQLLQSELRETLDDAHAAVEAFEGLGPAGACGERALSPSCESWSKRYRELLMSLERRASATLQTAESLANEIEGLVDRLGEESIRIRMVPLKQLFQKYPRMVRQIARSLGKLVEFEYEGEGTEIDKAVLEHLEDPILHMLRNAIDHGIERPEVRVRVGKPDRGHIKLVASHRQGRVVIELSDDGAGMSIERIGARALRAGLVTEERLREMDPHDVIDFVFNPGFSTKEVVTEISGRGVGMDVVRTNLGRLQGQVEIRSEPGRGTSLVLRMPLTLSIIEGVTVVDCGERYCLPAVSVVEVLKVSPESLTDVRGRVAMSYRGAVLPVVSLVELLAPGKVARPLLDRAGAGGSLRVAVLGSIQKKVGLVVDEIESEDEIVIKPFGSILRTVDNVSGVTIRPRGDLAVVLDAEGLIRSARRLATTAASPSPAPRHAEVRSRRPRVLLAEDSTTSREMLAGVLELGGYEVLTAVNGLEAWDRLSRGGVDLVVTDLDMPLMNGLELLARIRASQPLSRMPVIVVTTFGSDEDKARGLAAGASAYVVKHEFDQAVFRQRVHELIGDAAAPPLAVGAPPSREKTGGKGRSSL